MGSDGDDPAADWGDADPTEVNGVPVAAKRDEVTKPHGVSRMLEEAYERGRFETAGDRRDWFSEGQEDAMVALRAEFHAGGWADGIVEQVIAAVRRRLTRM